MHVSTAPRTLQLELGRRGKGREGRRENLGKCKRREKRRGKGERGAETQER